MADPISSLSFLGIADVFDVEELKGLVRVTLNTQGI